MISTDGTRNVLAILLKDVEIILAKSGFMLRSNILRKSNMEICRKLTDNLLATEITIFSVSGCRDSSLRHAISRKSLTKFSSVEKKGVNSLIKMEKVRGQRWCFTINNFNDIEEDNVRKLADNEYIKSVIAEEEHLDEGTPHIQGYLHTTKRVYASVVKNWLGGRAHIELARGSEKENWDYCTKEDQVIVEKKKKSYKDQLKIRQMTKRLKNF